MATLRALPSVTDPDALFAAFEEWATDQGLSLYPAQEEALIEIGRASCRERV